MCVFLDHWQLQRLCYQATWGKVALSTLDLVHSQCKGVVVKDSAIPLPLDQVLCTSAFLIQMFPFGSLLMGVREVGCSCVFAKTSLSVGLEDTFLYSESVVHAFPFLDLPLFLSGPRVHKMSRTLCVGLS